jgi:hypothetical protein
MYNAERTLETCLDALAAQNHPARDREVLLVDNGPPTVRRGSPGATTESHCSRSRTPSIVLAHGVFLVDGGKLPDELVETLRRGYPWLTVARAEAGTLSRVVRKPRAERAPLRVPHAIYF